MQDTRSDHTQRFDRAGSTACSARTQYVEVGSTRYAYRWFGNRSATPLVLLQRFRGTMDYWDPLLLDLVAAERELILLDNAGVGRSSGRVPDSIVGMAHNVAAVLERMELPQVDVLGWSMGGCVAQQLALDRPRLVRRLVLAATSPGGVADAPRMPDKVLQLMLKPVNDAEDFLYLFFPETERGREEGLACLRRLDGQRAEGIATVDGEGVAAQAKAIRAFTVGVDATLPRLAELRQPALVANGHRDIMIPAYSSYVMAQRLPDAHLILYPNAGHAFLSQNARAFSLQVSQFLQ